MLQFRYVRRVSRRFFAMWLGTFSLSQVNNVELARTLSWRENALFEERKRTFSLSQMNNVELARTSSWRENALFEERKRTCLGLVERIWRCGRLHVRFAPFNVRWQKYNKIDRTTKLFEGYSVPNP